VCFAQEKARVRAARSRTAARWGTGWSKAVAALGISEEESKEGRQIFFTQFMPEIVPSAGSDVQEGPHYVYHKLPWLSPKALLVLQRGHEYAAVYPDALPVVFSEDVSTTPSMCVVPATAPEWAVEDAA
jgi:hypothetical protein